MFLEESRGAGVKGKEGGPNLGLLHSSRGRWAWQAAWGQTDRQMGVKKGRRDSGDGPYLRSWLCPPFTLPLDFQHHHSPCWPQSHLDPCQPQGLCTGFPPYLEEPPPVFQMVGVLIAQGPACTPSREAPTLTLLLFISFCVFLTSPFGNLQ